ncbi:SDR family NAD(P)-dependent oxidoreductase [Psychrobacter sp. BF1]|uniref:SDR family NAD(P)-dependent oxidoreductase n=1 Tax=Psychrobacter sp. BF1 TaxID=2821147 RepID=UPI001C4E1894|nr:SDR family oxidoreductase [Psychrobacter sp. BF1]
MHNLLKDKVVLITGASSGIGKRTAIFFSQQGAKVIVTGRNQERLIETFNELQGDKHFSLCANLDSPDDIEQLIKSIVSEMGPLDGVVHCAGVQKTLPVKVLKETHFDEIFNANVKSAQFLAKSISRKGRFNPQGLSLIFLSSVAAVCGEPAISTYAASKAALQGLSKSLALELARLKIRVNCIAPGHVQTEMAKEFSQQLTSEQYRAIADKHPLGLGTPEDVAYAAAFLTSSMSRWVTGTTLYVDGGYSAH